MAPSKSSKKGGGSSRGRLSTTEGEDASTGLTQMIGGLKQDELEKFKSLIEKQLQIITPTTKAPSRKQGASSSKSVRSSVKSINVNSVNVNTDGDEEENEILKDDKESGDEESADEDEDVTFARLPKKRFKVTTVVGGSIHFDGHGQEWKTTLGLAVKQWCTDIDKDWRHIPRSSKRKIVDHMEARYGKGTAVSEMLFLAGRMYNHWKGALYKKDAEDIPCHIEPKVWERFQENKHKNHDQQNEQLLQKKNKDGEEKKQRWGRRGFPGIEVDYYRDWGKYPSAVTFKKILDKGTYKAYREDLIAEGRVPGNFKALDHIGKKGARKNRERNRQMKEKKKMEVHETIQVDAEAEGAAGNDVGANHFEADGLDVNNFELDEFDGLGLEGGAFDGGQGGDNSIKFGQEGDDGGVLPGGGGEDGDEQNYIVDEVNNAGSPDLAHEKTTQKELEKKKQKKKNMMPKKKFKRIKGRNLSPVFGDANASENIARYKSLQRHN